MATDWTGAKAAFVNSTKSMATIATEFGASLDATRKQAERGKWIEARRAASQKVADEAQSIMQVGRISTLAEFNQSDVRVAIQLRQQVEGHVKSALRRKRRIVPAELRALASAAEAAQRIGRLALGASTASTDLNGTLDVATTDLSGLSTEELRALHGLLGKAKKPQ